MLLHYLLIYSWPTYVMKNIEKWVRKFIWSGEMDGKMMIIIALHKCYSPVEEEGIVIRYIKTLDEATNLK